MHTHASVIFHCHFDILAGLSKVVEPIINCLACELGKEIGALIAQHGTDVANQLTPDFFSV
jgi:hypothetical protein